MKCPNCGAQTDSNKRKCVYCDAELPMNEKSIVQNITYNITNNIEKKKDESYSISDYKNFQAKKSVGNEVMEWLESIAVSIFIVILVFTFVFRMVIVDGRSMLPTLEDGQRLVISHLFYTPKQGDIVVVNSQGLNKTIIKRVIAIEGQTVDIDFDNHTVSVDGKVLDEPYINELTTNNDGGFEYPIVVPENSVFVMGDNRNHSTDSRNPIVGFITNDDVLGKAIFRIYPFNKFGRVK